MTGLGRILEHRTAMRHFVNNDETLEKIEKRLKSAFPDASEYELGDIAKDIIELFYSYCTKREEINKKEVNELAHLVEILREREK